MARINPTTRNQSALEPPAKSVAGQDTTAKMEAIAERAAQRALQQFKAEIDVRFDRLENSISELTRMVGCLAAQNNGSNENSVKNQPVDNQSENRPSTPHRGVTQPVRLTGTTSDPPRIAAKPKYIVQEIGYFDPDGYTATKRDVYTPAIATTATTAEHDVGRFIEAIEAAAKYRHETIIRLNLPRNLLGAAREWYLYELDDEGRAALRKGPGTSAWTTALRERFTPSPIEALDALQQEIYTVDDAAARREPAGYLQTILRHGKRAGISTSLCLVMAWRQIDLHLRLKGPRRPHSTVTVAAFLEDLEGIKWTWWDWEAFRRNRQQQHVPRSVPPPNTPRPDPFGRPRLTEEQRHDYRRRTNDFRTNEFSNPPPSDGQQPPRQRPTDRRIEAPLPAKAYHTTMENDNIHEYMDENQQFDANIAGAFDPLAPPPDIAFQCPLPFCAKGFAAFDAYKAHVVTMHQGL